MEGIFQSPHTLKLVMPTKIATLHRRRRISLRKTPPAPMISVIIPAHNEEAYIRQTLNAVNRQNYRPFEIIVVANGCTDRTAGVAERHCHNLIIVPEKGLSRARNLGADAARGEVLLFLDADTALEWDALANLAHRFTREHAAGTLKGKPDSDRLAYHLIYLLKNLQHRWSLHPGSSGVIFCWKDDFQAMGGFDEAMEVMENSDLIRKLTTLGKYLYIPESAVVTSMRRYEKYGFVRACKLWCKLWLQSLFSTVRHKRYEPIR